MRTFTESEARELLCPESIASGVHKTCCGNECVAFTETGPSVADWMSGVMDGDENRLYYCGMARSAFK